MGTAGSLNKKTKAIEIDFLKNKNNRGELWKSGTK